jgi:hypothetical protein
VLVEAIIVLAAMTAHMHSLLLPCRQRVQVPMAVLPWTGNLVRC